jgi:signal transduction histidine kinase/ActR/RegA family two-component response regulator
MSELTENLRLFCTPEFEKAWVVLALVCVSAVIALFGYLGRATGGRHFGMWAVAHLCYALYLAETIAFGMVPGDTVEATVMSAAVGTSALFMFWGNFYLADRSRTMRELVLAIVVMVAWCYAGAVFVRQPQWLIVPVFLLLGGARFQTGFLYLRYRDRNSGTIVLAAAFLLWGLHAVMVPFLHAWPVVMAAARLTSSVLALMIAIGMIVEEECKSAEEKYRGVLDASPMALLMVDLWTLRVLDSNKAARRLFKYDAEGLLGCSLLDLCPGLHSEGANLLDHRTMINAVFKPFNEFHIARSDGATELCEGDAHLVQWHKRAVLQINLREVDGDQKIGQLVRRAEKLSSLGQLIAGVAHELNNPLAVVVGYSQIMAKQPGIDGSIRSNVQKILHESERAAKIVRDLLSFARPCEPQMSVADINRLVANVLEIREPDLLGAGVRLERNLAPKLPKTKADLIQIEQVLTNLITNAMHAMMGTSEPRVLTVSTEEDGFRIRITVADSGPGIPQEIAGKIFDPFFTTKPPGKGTGLGLSISSTIMQEHRGKIWVQSELGKGSKFYVELPIVACEAETEAAAPVPEHDGAVPSVEQRLLIVDDEPGIRDVLQEVLGASGYYVDTASNGLEAVARIKSGRYDAIISDLGMPEMDGEKLYETVRDTDPRLAKRIIFVTGDTVSPKSRDFLGATGNRWLSKPFNIVDVEEVVSSLLKHDPLTELVDISCEENRPTRRYHPSTS